MNKQLAALLAGETDTLANSANFVALLYAGLPDINWLGIYVLRGNELVLGPFQGQPACVRIPLGHGVCGSAAEKAATQRVDDVRNCGGHIECDPASASEIVVPLLMHGRLVGVLDIDSPTLSRFGSEDQRGVEALCKTFLLHLESGSSDSANFI